MLLILTYYKYYILYYDKRILEEGDMKKNREASEAVTTQYFERLLTINILT
jgi:hypothetical protein